MHDVPFMAGLGILEAMKRANEGLQRAYDEALAVRVGIHTGLVVIGDIRSEAKREQLALGETLNVAARLQNLARPEAVVISATTYQLVRQWFRCAELGAHRMKGTPEPVAVFEALEERHSSELATTVTSGITSLVGREQELKLLLERWEQAKEGLGQVVLLGGEAGVGECRILHELAQLNNYSSSSWRKQDSEGMRQNLDKRAARHAAARHILIHVAAIESAVLGSPLADMKRGGPT
jgi:hypothetical protein